MSFVSMVMDSPLGAMRLVASEGALTGVYFSDHERAPGEFPLRDDEPVLLETARQLREYFSGERRDFDLPLRPRGTAFQQRVWAALREIPFGATSSYLALARSVSSAKACRAVGAANGRNPISIIVPCHRVIGSDGSLTGYAGGMGVKRWLLDHEARCSGSASLSLGLFPHPALSQRERGT